MLSEISKIRFYCRLLLMMGWVLMSAISLRAQVENRQLIQPHFTTEDSVRILKAYHHYADHPDTDSSILGLKGVLAECQLISFNSRAIWTANKLGNLYAEIGDYQQAMNYYKMAIATAQQYRGKLSLYLSTGYNNIANMHASVGDYSQSAQIYFKALLYVDYYGTILPKESILLNLSQILVQLGQYHQAHFHLNHAERLAQQENNLTDLTNISMTRGIIESKKRNWEQSNQYLQHALAIARKHNFTDLLYVINCNIADNYYNQDKLDTAVPYLKALLAMKHNVKSYYANQAELMLGKYYLNSGQYAKAEPILLRALHTAEQMHYVTRLPAFHDVISDLYKATERPGTALWHKEQYMVWKDSMANRQTTWRVNQLEVKYRTLEKDKQIAENLLLIKNQENHFKQKHLLLQIGIVGFCSFSIFLFLIYRINLKKKEKQLSLLQNEQILLQQKEISLVQAQEILQLKSIIKGEEQERSRIARDLHDGLGGLITAIRLNLGAAIGRRHSPQREIILEETEVLLGDMAAEVRNIAHNLVPKNLLDKSLEEALLTYRNTVNKGNQLAVELHTYGDFGNLTNDAKLGIYRIIQELIQNIIKHAMATTATIQILRVKDSLRITIEDDGRGFDLEEAKDGIGLDNVKLRVLAMQGDLSIQSSNDRGTTIYIEFNIEQLILKDDLHITLPNHLYFK